MTPTLQSDPRRPAKLAALAVVGLAWAFWAAVAAIGYHRAELTAPRATPILEDRQGNFLSEGEGKEESLGYWDVSGPLNPKLVLCITAIEDRRFYAHPGVDPWAVVRALCSNIRGGARQGASTLAMQVARLEYPAERTWINKLLEASTAGFLVLRHGHDAVLRHYLKLMPQGNRIHGAAYAARRFFRKPIQDLSLAESALLAALPKAPGSMNLFSWDGLQKTQARAGLILRVLLQRGQIGQEDYEAALRQFASMYSLVREIRPPSRLHFVLRTLEEDGRQAVHAYDRALRTSLDPGIQDMVERVAARAVRENVCQDMGNLAMVVADRTSGEVLAYIGSAGFFDERNAGAINYARTPRSSGSILKPLLFAKGLDDGGFTPSSVLADLPFAMIGPNGEYHVSNFDDAYLGPMIYRRALANSRNIPALRVLEGVGLPEFYTLLKSLDLVSDDRGSDYYGYGMAIGGMFVTLENVVAAYGTLANDGKRFRLRWFKPEDRTGEATEGAVSAPAGQDGEAMFSPYAARVVGQFLSDAEARYPSFPRLNILEYGFPVAIKTGTSQGYRDAWSVAWTSRFVVGVWMGNPGNRPMNQVAGIVSAAYLHDILVGLHPWQDQGVDTEALALPEPAVSRKICLLSGQEVGPDCPACSLEWFRPDQVVHDTCSVHRRFVVDKRDGSLATSATPPAAVLVKAYTVLPPQYALWGLRHGIAPQPEAGGAELPRRLTVSYPLDGGRFLVDPTQPAQFQTLPLQALVSPRGPLVEWYVDGKVVARVPWPYEYRWPLARGLHEICAGLAGAATRTPAVRISVD